MIITCLYLDVGLLSGLKVFWECTAGLFNSDVLVWEEWKRLTWGSSPAVWRSKSRWCSPWHPAWMRWFQQQFLHSDGLTEHWGGCVDKTVRSEGSSLCACLTLSSVSSKEVLKLQPASAFGPASWTMQQKTKEFDFFHQHWMRADMFYLWTEHKLWEVWGAAVSEVSKGLWQESTDYLLVIFLKCINNSFLTFVFESHWV